METLPRNTLFEILLYLSGADLLNFCSTYTIISSVCDENNDDFWKMKVVNDYPNQNIPNKPNNISWKRFYILLGTSRRYIKQIPVTFDNPLNDNIEQIGQIWINYTDPPGKILGLANNLFINKYPNYDPLQLTIINNNFEINMRWIYPISHRSLIVNYNENYYNLINELRFRYIAFTNSMDIAMARIEALP